VRPSDGSKIVALDDVMAIACGGDLNLETNRTAIHVGDNVRMALVPDLDYFGTNATQHMSKQALGTKSELDVAYFSPETSEDLSECFKATIQELARPLA